VSPFQGSDGRGGRIFGQDPKKGNAKLSARPMTLVHPFLPALSVAIAVRSATITMRISSPMTGAPMEDIWIERLTPGLSPRERRVCWVIVALGVLFRVADYLSNRSFWMDESSLAGSISGRTLAGFLEPLAHTQLAPPGFLAFEMVVLRTLGQSPFALRLFPLICGVASLPLFLALAARCLRPAALMIAVALFAFSDDLIYFSAEFKQYETDVAVGLACTLMGVVTASRPVSAYRYLAFGAIGATAVWFSHASAFVLAGVGTVLFASAIARRDRGAASALIPVGLAWVTSIAVVHVISRRHLGPPAGMWTFWAFAFPPMPPASAWDATWLIRRFLYLFVNPLDFGRPFSPFVSMLPALGFFAVGCASMGARDRRVLGILAVPALFTAIAACLRLYPFHGRLLLFLVPAFLLLISEGAGRIGEAIGRRGAWAVILGVLLLDPSVRALYHLAEPRDRNGFHPQGDRRPASLDAQRFPF
jgi:hypothetical protein